MDKRSLRFGINASLVVSTLAALVLVVVGRRGRAEPDQGVVELEPLTPFGGEIALGVGVVLLVAVLVLVVATLLHARRAR